MIRSLTVADAPACLALTDDRGWVYSVARWEFLLGVGAGFGIDAPDGGLAGVVLLTRYPTGLAGIGTMLVAGRFGRQGLGTELMRHALDAAGDDTVFLYATAQGRPLYERLGFRATGRVDTLLGQFRPDAPDRRSRAATPDDLPEIGKLDAEVFGADRSDLLGRLSGMRVIESGGRLTGYAATTANKGVVTIGPLVAAGDADAAALITGAAAGHPDIRLELAQTRPELREWAGGCGVIPVSGNEFMIHGDRELPGDRSRLYLPVMTALG